MVRSRKRDDIRGEQRTLDRLPVGRSRSLEAAAMRQTAQRHQRFDTHRPVHLVALRQIGDLPRQLGCADLRGALARIAHLAAVGGSQVRQRPKQRGLAGAVRPDQADDLTGVGGEVDAAQRVDLAEPH